MKSLCVPLLILCAFARALPAEEPADLNDDTVTINCPDELELNVLVDYVGKALNLRFVYGQELGSQRFVLRPSPVQLPKERLLPVLADLLRIHDLALVREGEDLYRILHTEQAARSVEAVLDDAAPLDAASVRMVTQIIPVHRKDVAALAEKLPRFLSSSKAGLLPVPEAGLLVVTDYESRIATVRSILALLDRDQPGIDVRTIEVPADQAVTLAARVTAILGELQHQRNSDEMAASVRADVAPGQMVVIGRSDQIDRAVSLIEQMTAQPISLITQAYSPRHMSVARAKSLIEHVVLAPGEEVVPPTQTYVDGESEQLFVTAPKATHEAIVRMLALEDKPLPETRRPLRIYRPKHRKAAELLGTLNQLLSEGVPLSGAESNPETQLPARSKANAHRAAGLAPPQPPQGMETDVQGRTSPRVTGPDYVLTVDEHTNAILAVGTREFQAMLAELIDDLDVRRPQVLVEMTLVAVTLSDSQDLGVELQSLDLGDGWDYLLFTSFGLSSTDVVTGQRILNPGVGANGVLIGPEEVPIIIHALATRGLARVISTPRILVADNAQGVLRNVDEAPFTSVNASDTVATTSFGGFESAGTTLTVTPHIAEGDHLTLEYELSFSNFSGGASGAGVPPPRTTNSFSSTVEVPDGYTVVTGGLAVDNQSDSHSEVPLLGRIPHLGKLFQSSSRQHNKTRIFAFIRPIILREDKFEDLKFISLKDIEDAGLAPDGRLPGEPHWMK